MVERILITACCRPEVPSEIQNKHRSFMADLRSSLICSLLFTICYTVIYSHTTSPFHPQVAYKLNNMRCHTWHLLCTNVCCVEVSLLNNSMSVRFVSYITIYRRQKDGLPTSGNCRQKTYRRHPMHRVMVYFSARGISLFPQSGSNTQSQF